MDIGKVLRYYGAQGLPDSGGWRTIKCVFHPDSRGSGRVSIRDGAYCCQACPAKGNCISLVMWKEQCDYQAAIRLLAEILGDSNLSVRISDDDGGSPVPSRARPFEGNRSALSARRRSRPFA